MSVGDRQSLPHLHRASRLLDMLGEAPLSLACVAHVLPEEIDGFVDPACPQVDAFKHHGCGSLVERPVLVHPRSFATCPNDHDVAGCALTRADAYARRGAEVTAVRSMVARRRSTRIREIGSGG